MGDIGDKTVRGHGYRGSLPVEGAVVMLLLGLIGSGLISSGPAAGAEAR